MEIKLTPTRDSDNSNADQTEVVLSAYGDTERTLRIQIDGRVLHFAGSGFAKALRALDVKE